MHLVELVGIRFCIGVMMLIVSLALLVVFACRRVQAGGTVKASPRNRWLPVRKHWDAIGWVAAGIAALVLLFTS